jgi:Mg-chelatase subunit ChlD
VGFDSSATAAVPITRDKQHLVLAIESLFVGGGTNMAEG